LSVICYYSYVGAIWVHRAVVMRFEVVRLNDADARAVILDLESTLSIGC